MDSLQNTAEAIVKKLQAGEDTVVFAPVFCAGAKITARLFATMKQTLLCVVRNAPPQERRMQYGSSVFFADSHTPDGVLEQTLRDAEQASPAMVYITPEVLLNDLLFTFIERIKPAALLVTEAESAAPVLFGFNKRLRNIREFRAHLQQPLPVCLFCAMDTSLLLRDVYNALGIVHPALFYPGARAPESRLTAGCVDSPFAALEKHMHREKLYRVVAYCPSYEALETAYEYFLFYNYNVERIHGGFSQEKRMVVANRFFTGETDMLLTTMFPKAIYKKDLALTAYLGLPSDLCQLLRSACNPGGQLAVFYTKESANDTLLQIADLIEVRERYSVLARQRLMEERIRLLRQSTGMFAAGQSLSEALHKAAPQIY